LLSLYPSARCDRAIGLAGNFVLLVMFLLQMVCEILFPCEQMPFTFYTAAAFMWTVVLYAFVHFINLLLVALKYISRSESFKLRAIRIKTVINSFVYIYVFTT
jgi:hypothetical protein